MFFVVTTILLYITVGNWCTFVVGCLTVGLLPVILEHYHEHHLTMATAVVRCVVCEIELDDSVADTASASQDNVSTDTISGNDRRCDNDDSVVDDDLKRVTATHFYNAADEISTFQSKSVGRSLPSLPKQDSTELSHLQTPLSVSCCDLSTETLPGRVSTSTEIPSTGFFTVIVEDSGIGASRESPSHTNIVLSDTDSVEEADINFEPFCRICQLPGDSSSSSDNHLVSPCRCAGSLQYAHTACLVVSCRFLMHVYVWYIYSMQCNV